MLEHLNKFPVQPSLRLSSIKIHIITLAMDYFVKNFDDYSIVMVNLQPT